MKIKFYGGTLDLQEIEVGYPPPVEFAYQPPPPPLPLTPFDDLDWYIHHVVIKRKLPPREIYQLHNTRDVSGRIVWRYDFN